MPKILWSISDIEKSWELNIVDMSAGSENELFLCRF